MSDPRKHGATGVWSASILAGLVLIPALYIVLLGPLALLLANGTISHNVWFVVTQPAVQSIAYLGKEPEWLWMKYVQYLKWWASLA